MENNIVMTTYDDITTGSELNEFNNLKYKTHLKNVDRRIFTDGIYVKKTKSKL